MWNEWFIKIRSKRGLIDLFRGQSGQWVLSRLPLTYVHETDVSSPSARCVFPTLFVASKG